VRAGFAIMFGLVVLSAIVAAALGGCAGRAEPRADLDAQQAAAARSACSFTAGERAGLTVARQAPVGDALPIDTIVVVLLQGRSFDHLLGTMRGDVDAVPAGANNIDANGLLVPTVAAARHCVDDPGDDWRQSHIAFGGGTNDGFVRAAAPSFDDPTGARVMEHYGPDDLPILHALAGNFALSDRHFAAMLAGADANRALLYAATTHGALDEAVADGVTLFDLLDAAGISWRVYTGGDGPPALAAVRARHADRFVGGFGRDAAAGRLPGVAFVEVSPPYSGAARYDFRAPGDVQVGDRFLAELYADVTTSPQWSRMAVLITFLDGGGFYDHVPPPAACRPDAWGPGPGRDDLPFTFDRDGFRVPLIVVSPWARAGFVSHAPSDHVSITRLIEARFGLPALTARDANADPLLDLFDFAAPRPGVPALPPPRLDSDEIDRCVDTYP
jgi:phospholipase C